MAQHQRLCSGDSIMKMPMRRAIAMIELIFAMVIIAISVISIPTMISVADQASKQMIMDDDVVSRIAGWTMDKFQARWDQRYAASGSNLLVISGTADLGCSRGSGSVRFRANPDSAVMCDDQNLSPSGIGSAGAGTADGNLTKGIEQLNGGSETLTVSAATGEHYTITASYAVGYVEAGLTSVSDNRATATWRLGSSTDMNPDASGTSHLKRVVTRFNNAALGVDTTLTFFKSNKGN